jgi:hypothetical protein
MATQEERLSKVEQFTEVAASHIQETEENTTILLGVIRSQGHDVRDIKNDLRTIRAEMNELDGRLNQRLDDVISQLALILQRLPAKE